MNSKTKSILVPFASNGGCNHKQLFPYVPTNKDAQFVGTWKKCRCGSHDVVTFSKAFRAWLVEFYGYDHSIGETKPRKGLVKTEKGWVKK